MIKLISGGQTGADLAGLWIATCFGLPSGGWAPSGWRTQIGPQPTLASWGLMEHHGGYKPRTIANVDEADLTIICSGKLSPGTRLTIDTAIKLQKPLYVFRYDPPIQDAMIDDLAVAIRQRQLLGDMIINVAGNATQTDSRAFGFTFRLLWSLLVRLGHQPQTDLSAGHLIAHLQDKYT